MSDRRSVAATLDEPGLLEALDWEDDGVVADHLAVLVDPDAASLARRDAALLELHRDRYGALLRCAGDCPACGETLEISIPVAELLPPPLAAADPRVEVDGIEVRFRLPSAEDVLAAVDERSLAERCVTSARRKDDGAAVDPADLSDLVVMAIDAAMAALHPAAGLTVDVVCGTCGERWDAPLDVAGLVAARARVDALALVAEVHALATAYGWTEAEVLAVPRARRRRYLELVGA